MLRIYNTLTKKVDDFVTINKKLATIYTCGPTVYDYPHIGNWFTFIRYDMIVRTLRLSGYKTKWVMNITDVGHLTSDADEGEDKLEKGAKREGKTAWEIADYYAKYFINGLNKLNIITPDYIPKATDHIKEQIELIQKLYDLGYAYKIDDGIYYDTSEFDGYAAFANLDLDDQKINGRIEHNSQKRNSADFALWKFSPKNHKRDMEWKSPWGIGFPGWHIECSAMSMKYLGNTIDIHTGGIDHIPVHHTNEIAQSEAVTGVRFSNYWMHTNHILFNDQKLSKSLGNGITLENILEHGYSLQAFRLHVLESHYRSQSKFSWDSLESAQNRLNSYKKTASLIWQPKNVKSIGEDKFTDLINDIAHKLQDDINTPKVLAKINAFFDLINNNLLSSNDIKHFDTLLKFINDALGIRLNSDDISQTQKHHISQRQQAREKHDWRVSDEIRDILLDQGISIKDTDHGPIWSKIS